MPDNLACTGASTGNICTVHCRNNAIAGPFGGCFAVQQTDVAASANSANTITTAQTLKAIEAQVQENNVNLPVAVAANQAAGSADGVEGFDGANAILSASITSKAAPVMTLSVDNVGVNAAAATAKATTAAKGNGKGKNNNNNQARGLSLKWASRLFAADSWEEPST